VYLVNKRINYKFILIVISLFGLVLNTFEMLQIVLDTMSIYMAIPFGYLVYR